MVLESEVVIFCWYCTYKAYMRRMSGSEVSEWSVCGECDNGGCVFRTSPLAVSSEGGCNTGAIVIVVTLAAI